MFSELKPKLWIDYKYAPIRKNTKFLRIGELFDQLFQFEGRETKFLI
jgi:hypothetical protein